MSAKRGPKYSPTDSSSIQMKLNEPRRRNSSLHITLAGNAMNGTSPKLKEGISDRFGF